ncbi:hypothetical protein EES39_38650 [Streptomyces sp. ADI92-24]|uniref:DUF2637 domain-containing protein n=1 Tax=Streptomyces sp. ADI92-24 TaxID=1522756 RepID=UPI000F551F34|nr:DUF2637 domain-containing protein [Streptomyces sp. ADI92-24]RPK32410.1 hypothetical protein EES39_38650 [Streptomyces sp. ADI92-24]
MDLSNVVLPAGIGLAALCVLVTVALVLRSRRSREQDKMSAEERERLAEERRKTWRRRLGVISLSGAFVIIFCIAGIAAWLSFGAQKAYAFDRNGGSWDAATGFALLLDAGALGLSLLRLFEALTARSSQLTRLYLVLFVVTSATMNLLHTPHDAGESPTLGGRLVAVIPPLVYAAFLESLLKKVEQLVLGKYPKKKIKKNVERGYSLLLWVPFVGYPWQMWKQWRSDLHDTLQYVRAPGSRNPLPSAPMAGTDFDGEGTAPRAEPPPAPREAAPAVPAPQAATASLTPRPVPVQQRPAAPSPASVSRATGPIGSAAAAPPTTPPAPAPQVPVEPRPAPAPQTSANRSKKDQLRDVLVAQIQAGDLRVLDENAVLSNGAAYQANMQLGKAAGLPVKGGKQEGILAEGAVRSAVKTLRPELRQLAEDLERARIEAAAAPQPVPAPVPEPVPEHQGTEDDGTVAGEESRERLGQEAPGIGQQRGAAADTSDEEKEAALA